MRSRTGKGTGFAGHRSLPEVGEQLNELSEVVVCPGDVTDLLQYFKIERCVTCVKSGCVLGVEGVCVRGGRGVC